MKAMESRLRTAAQIVLALPIVFCPAMAAAQDRERAAMVRVGDLVFATPTSLGAAFVPESAGAKTNFDYHEIGKQTAPAGVRNVDTVIIRLEKLWPLSKEQQGQVLAIQADSRAAQVDLFCRSKSRTGARPDAGKALKTDGQFYVFKEPLTAGLVYMAQGDLLAFGAPITAWRTESPLAKQLHPGGEEQFSFQIVLSKNTRLALLTVAYQISRETLPLFLASIQKQIRSWIVIPDPASFRWFHERESAC